MADNMTDNMTVQDAPDSMNPPRRPSKGDRKAPPSDIADQLPLDPKDDSMQPGAPRPPKGDRRKDRHQNQGMGGDGNDTLTNEKSGKMTLQGGAGDDKLIGGKGKDLLVGGEGNDILFGHRGSNVMMGGTGSDVFVLNRGRGFNIVKDFNALEGDKLALPKGLTFEKLMFIQIGNDTLIQREHRKIGLLLGVQANSITADSLIKPPSLTAPISPVAPSPLPVA
jgi:RTX calcium-binding nonapeptide repeat (4 copies)